MTVRSLSDADFEGTIREAENAIVDFYATWCGQCMLIRPKFEQLSQEFPHVHFFVVDAEANPQTRKSLRIEGIPYFALYRNGQFLEGFLTSRIEKVKEKLIATFGQNAQEVAG
ncbi:MAG: thioredoxin family protein [Sandaracinaceae bacterium]|nr:thioredoxin family protein [Sandaracinaceae bacterium]